MVRRENLDQVVPTEVGSWGETAWDLPDKLVFCDNARRFECGTRDAASITGVAEAVRFIQSVGLSQVARHGLKLADYLRSELKLVSGLKLLSPTRPELRSAMVSFSVNGKHCDDVFRDLLTNGFRCRPVRERGLNAVRISTHIFNSMSECEQLICFLRQYI